MTTPEDPPVVAMVSYAWGDEEHEAHREKVKALVIQLRENGIGLCCLNRLRVG